MPEISVIMPVYKVEAYVGKTIESVLNQTFKDFEFWAVDDGSPDKSGSICDEYAQKDGRLKVIHKKNGGAPSARNQAIGMASGKYLYFIDSDDWIEPDMLQTLYALAENNRADLVVTGFCMEYFEKDHYATYKTRPEDRVYEHADEFRRNAYQYFNASLLSLPWNKLYRKDIVVREHIRFPDVKWDDHHFNMDYLMNVQKVVMSSAAMYHWYRSRPESETRLNYADPNLYEIRREHYLHIQKLYTHWQVDDEASIESISAYYIGRILQCVQEIADSRELSYSAKRQKVSEILNDKETGQALRHCKSASGVMKILFLPLRAGNVSLSLLFGSGISLSRRLFPALFIKLKEKEVHHAA